MCLYGTTDQILSLGDKWRHLVSELIMQPVFYSTNSENTVTADSECAKS